MVNFKNVISLSLALSVTLSASEVAANKRSWQEAFEDGNFEAASQAARKPQFFHPNEAYNGLEMMGTPCPQGTIAPALLPG